MRKNAPYGYAYYFSGPVYYPGKKHHVSETRSSLVPDEEWIPTNNGVFSHIYADHTMTGILAEPYQHENPSKTEVESGNLQLVNTLLLEPIAYYKCDDYVTIIDPIIAVLDSSSNGYDGVPENVEAGDLLTKSLVFKGQSYIDLEDIASFEWNDEFTFDFWIKVDTIDDKYGQYIVKRLNYGTNRGYYIKVIGGFALEIGLINSLSAKIVVQTSLVLVFNTWTHVVIRYDGSGVASGIDVTINFVHDVGIVVVDDTLGGSTIINVNANLHVGEFRGLLDEFVIYDEEISDSILWFRYYNGDGNEDMPTDLIPTGHYNCNEGSGVSLLDDVGTNNLTAVGIAVWNMIDPKIGAACLLMSNDYRFDGTSGMFQYDRDDTFTVEFWFKTTYTGGTDRVAISVCDTGTSRKGWLVYIDNSVIYFEVSSVHGSSAARVKTGSTYANGSWYHCVCTYDGLELAAGLHIYINNINDTVTDRDDLFNTSDIITGGTFSVGSRGGSTTGRWDGELDEIVIYDYVITDLDREFRYQSGVGTEEFPVAPSVYGHYHLNIQIGDVVPDSSSNGRNGTLFNGEYDVLGKLNDAINFGITDISYVHIGSPPEIVVGSTDFSIDLRFKSDDDTMGKFIHRDDLYSFGINEKGKIFFERVDDGGKKYHVETLLAGFNDNIWHHVALVYSSSYVGVKYKIYIDNSIETLVETDTSYVGPSTVVGDLILGKWYKGNVREIALFDNKSLTTYEVNVRYLEKFGGGYDTIQSWYATSNANNVEDWYTIVSIAINDDATHPSVSIKYLFGLLVDTTWIYYKWMVDQWIPTIDLHNGNTKAELLALTDVELSLLISNGHTDIRILVSLRSTDSLYTPKFSDLELIGTVKQQICDSSILSVNLMTEHRKIKIKNVSHNTVYNLKLYLLTLY